MLVIHAHPSTESLTAHLLGRVLKGLAAGGHEAGTVDLYSDRPGDANDLSGVDAVVWVYPTWWSGPPAIVKSWIDQNWPASLPGVQAMIVVTTHGSPRWVNRVEGEVGRALILRGLRRSCRRHCRRRWIALYNLDRANRRAITSFADRVERTMARL